LPTTILPTILKQLLEQKQTTERRQIPVLKNRAIHHVSTLPEAVPSMGTGAERFTTVMSSEV
jgi:hypothetical protein